MSTNGTLLTTLCDSYRLWPTTSVCSGHGSCIASIDSNGIAIGRCACNSGWHGRGEWIDRSDRDCNVSDNAMTTIHVMGVVIAFWCVVFAARTTYRVMQRYRDSTGVIVSSAPPSSVIVQPQPQALSSGKAGSRSPVMSARPSSAPLTPPAGAGAGTGVASGSGSAHVIIQVRRPPVAAAGSGGAAARRPHDSLWAALVADPASRLAMPVLWHAASCVIYHMNRVVGDNSEIHRSWLSAMAVCFSPPSFWIGTAVFALILIKHTISGMTHERGAAGAAATIATLRPLMFIGAAIGSVGSVTLPWVRLVSSDSAQEVAMIVHYSIIICTGTWMVCNTRYHGFQLLAQIDSLQDPKLAATRKRVVVAITLLTNASMGNITTAFFFTCWPLLRAQTSYMTPTLLIIGNVISILALWIFAGQSRRVTPATAATTPAAVAKKAVSVTQQQQQQHEFPSSQPSPVPVVGSNSGHSGGVRVLSPLPPPSLSPKATATSSDFIIKSSGQGTVAAAGSGQSSI